MTSGSRVGAAGPARRIQRPHGPVRNQPLPSEPRRDWPAGATVRQCDRGLRAWGTIVRLARRGAADLVVVASLDMLSDTDAGMVAVLGLLVRSGARLWAVADGIDTADPIGRALVSSLLGGAV